MTGYQYLRSKNDEIKRLLDSYPLLREIFNAVFFSEVNRQIDEMEKRKIDGPIHPMFLFILHSGERAYG